MKKVFSNHNEVAHVWASQSQSEGAASNIFFDGPSIYSYGRHFEIARIIKPGVVFFNPASYSVSTSKHQSRARAAVSHMKIFVVPSMTDHNANVEYLLNTLETELLSITRKRKDGEFFLEAYSDAVENAWEYVSLFKIKKPLFVRMAKVYAVRENPLTPGQLAKFKAKTVAAREKAKTERALREVQLELRRRIAQKDYDAWKAGVDVRLDWEMQQSFPVALRLKDNEIQTTRGATVPVIEAKKLWRALRTNGAEVIGMRVGHFTVTRIDKENDTVIIGCHTIPMNEVVRMAVTLGITESEAA